MVFRCSWFLKKLCVCSIPLTGGCPKGGDVALNISNDEPTKAELKPYIKLSKKLQKTLSVFHFNTYYLSVIYDLCKRINRCKM